MLEITNLSLSFGEHEVLRGIDLRVERGEIVALIGPNGCGKTTLLRAITGIATAQSGEIMLDAGSITDIARSELAKRVAVVAQNAILPEGFTAFEIALMGRTPHLRLLQSEGRRDLKIVQAAMERADCWQLRDRPVDQLSGGERQRVIIARALSQEPELLLLDEPTSHLDVQHQVEAFRLLRRLCRERELAVIAVVHDLTLAAMFADGIALMSLGRIVAAGAPAEVLDAGRIERVYGVPVRVFAHPDSGAPIVVPMGGPDLAQRDDRRRGVAS